MADEDQSSPSFDLRTALLVAALIGGAALIPSALRSSRPSEKETLERTAVGDQVVSARLWQDPFEVTTAYQASHREKIRSEITGADAARTNPALHSLGELCQQLGRHAGTKGQVTVLEVMISGGSYAEDAEVRHRDRYAVLSALHVAGFVPWDAEHLGYAQTDWPRGKELEGVPLDQIPALRAITKHPDSALIIPFEWFVPNRLSVMPQASGDLLVVWLNADAFDDHPIKRLAQFNHYLTERTNYLQGVVPDMVFKLLQPRLGSMLRELASDPKNLDLASKRTAKATSSPIKFSSALGNLQLYSSWSTTPDALLSPGPDLPGRSAFTTQPGCGWSFCNVTCTDDQLIEQLIDELSLRRVDVTNPKHRIVLISEWDTDYGRALPLTFAAVVNCLIDRKKPPGRQLGLATNFAAAVEALKTNSDSWPANIMLCTYLRGIDGKVPGVSSSSETQTGKSSTKDNSNSSDGETPDESQRPEGHSQMDYLPRLATSLADFEAELKTNHTEYKAIGILGSDVYDKLLVLQALRHEFTDELFFTTDLDARMLHPDTLKWTRNVLVASSFGLELSRDFQKEIPPFRDTYQTGQYLACLAALNYPRVTASNLTGLTPCRYEIGRSGAFDLSQSNSRFQLSSERPGVIDTIWNLNFLAWASVAACSAALAVIFTRRARKVGRILYEAIKTKPKPPSPFCECKPWQFRLLIWLPILMVGILCFFVAWDNGNPRGEPFSLSEGISVWPTELLRFLAACLTLVFVFKANADLKENQGELHQEFKFPPVEPMPPPAAQTKAARFWQTLKAAFVLDFNTEKTRAEDQLPKSEIYQQFSRLTSSQNRMIRTCVPAVVYLIVSALFYCLFDRPFQPTRGRCSYLWDCIVSLSNSVLLVLLIFFVVDASRLCRKFIDNLTQASTRWPNAYSRKAQLEHKLDDLYLDQYIDLRIIAKRSDAVGRLIFYPFFVLFVIIIARNNFFDRWDWPPTILLFLGLCSAYAVYAVWSLRRAAENAREALLDKLNAKLLSRENHGLSDQLRLMIRLVKSCQEGAFAPVTQQPVIRALLMPFGGAGILTLLNYLGTKM